MRTAVPVIGPKPLACPMDWVHSQRLFRKVLDHARVQLIVGGGPGEWIVASAVDVRQAVTEMMGTGLSCAAAKTVGIQDQNTDASSELTSRRFVDVVAAQLGERGKGTVLLLRAAALIFEPQRERDFGDPFECVRAMNAGLQIFRATKAFVSVTAGLNQKDHGVGSALMSCYELMVEQQTGYILSMFLEPSIPWEVKASLHENSTLAVESFFGEARCALIVKCGSINKTIAEFLLYINTLEALRRAKARIADQTGIRMSAPRQRAKTATKKKMSTAVLAKNDFVTVVGRMDYDAFVKRVAEEQERGVSDGIALIKRLVPTLAAALEKAPSVYPGKSRLEVPLAPTPFHATDAFRAAVHKGNGAIKPGGGAPKHPATPGYVDQAHLLKAESDHAAWKKEQRDAEGDDEGAEDGTVEEDDDAAAAPPMLQAISPLLPAVLGRETRGTLLYALPSRQAQPAVVAGMFASLENGDLPPLPVKVQPVELDELADAPADAWKLEVVAVALAQGREVVSLSCCRVVAIAAAPPRRRCRCRKHCRTAPTPPIPSRPTPATPTPSSPSLTPSP